MKTPRGTARALRRPSAASSIPLIVFGGKRTQNIMDQFHCSAERACAFIGLRDEGHSITAAALMAGISDPA